MRFAANDLNVQQDGASKIARKVFHTFVEGELTAMSLFDGLPSKTLKQLVPLFSLEEWPAGTSLFDVGNPGDKVYMLMHGSITVSKGQLVLATLTAEQGVRATSASGSGLPVFGEMAMLDRKPRVAAARCATDVKLLVLPVDQFTLATMIVPDIKSRLRRLKETRRVQNEVTDRRAGNAYEWERMCVPSPRSAASK